MAIAKPAPPVEQDSFLQALLGIQDMAGFATLAKARLLELGVDEVELVWNDKPDDPGQLHTAHGAAPNPSQLLLLEKARRQGGRAQDCYPSGNAQLTVLLAQNAGFWAGLLCRYRIDRVPANWQEQIELLSLRCHSLLRTQRLQIDLERLASAERLQRALFAISDITSSDQSTAEVLRGLHQIVGSLMYAENFYIVRFDPIRETIRFIYFADSHDLEIPDPDKELSPQEMGNSLTLAVLRQGKPARGPSWALLEALNVVRSLDDSLGPDSEDWLGVPIVEDNVVRGAIVVQSYDASVGYSEADQALLSYVAQHILSALSRRDAQEELERRVELRTTELRQEIRERLRSEQLQRALYHIAELSGSSDSMEAFYASVHEIVGQLLDARNFYIGLLTADGQELQFPYSIDEHDLRLPRRMLGRGLSEYVLRTAQPLLIDRAGIEALAAAGEVHSMGTKSVCWLGVPLMLDGRVIGLITVQSYTPDYAYSSRDEALLSFVSFHIANALARRQAKESLLAAYAEMEQRVSARTSELAETNRALRNQISVREGIEFQLKHDALHDPLTGLANRSQLLLTLAQCLSRYQQDRANEFAVLFLDLDRFKIVNDSVGHLVGDELLKEAALRISRCISGPDLVARLGGDEFAIVLDHIASTSDATMVAERVIRALSEPIRIAGKELYTSASIGVARCNERYCNPEELLRDADVAMYRAKAAGRQRYALFDEGLHDDAILQLELEGDLRRGLQREQFIPFYQPIVQLSDGVVLGFEALMRWEHPKRGCLLPKDFLAAAEESGTLEQMDWQLYDQVFRDIGVLCVAGKYVTINVSPRHLRVNDFGKRMLLLLQTHQIPAEQVRLEITEGALLENPEQVQQCLCLLRDAGVHTFLDDFGTGYSSLSYLHRFALHGLKIDRSFVAALRSGESGGTTAIVRAIRLLADALGLEVIAEGIETQEQCQQLRQLGLTKGQGYLFGLPAPLRAISKHFVTNEQT